MRQRSSAPHAVGIRYHTGSGFLHEELIEVCVYLGLRLAKSEQRRYLLALSLCNDVAERRAVIGRALAAPDLAPESRSALEAEQVRATDEWWGICLAWLGHDQLPSR